MMQASWQTQACLDILPNTIFSTTRETLCLYADHAYPLKVHLQKPFRIVAPNPLMEE